MGRINSVIKLRESVMALTAVEHDELTGVYTRQAFFYHAKSFLKTRPGEKFHLVIADIRDFKLINSSQRSLPSRERSPTPAKTE